MSKHAACDVAMRNGKSDSAPYSVAARRKRSRELAQKRRTTYKSIMDDLTQTLPFPEDVVSQLDYNSRLRLCLCFFRLKTLLANGKAAPDSKMVSGDVDNGVDNVEKESWSRVVAKSTDGVQQQPFKLFQPGMLQTMMTEALDGFLLVASSQGTIVFLSESVHHHMGIFQSEHIGINLYDIISEDDHDTVRGAISKAETAAMSYGLKRNRGAQVEFFCRMKCSRFKVPNIITKSPGFKVVYVSGSIKVMGSNHFLVTVVRPVSPPSILEIRMEANMFVSHYDMKMNCIFFDGRLKHLLGYMKYDVEGVNPMHFKHHDDTAATVKCSQGILSKGEGLSGYYRFRSKLGFNVWLQTRGSLMYDSRTGKPTHLVCLNYIISKEKGDVDLNLRNAITATPGNSNHSYDPFPITHRTDGSVVNPFTQTSWHDKDLEIDDFLTKNESQKEELDVDVMAIKEEFQMEPKSVPDSGVHSSNGSLIHSHSHHSSRSTVFHSAGPSPSSYSDLSPNSDLSTTQIPPDSTSDLPTTKDSTIVHPRKTIICKTGDSHHPTSTQPSFSSEYQGHAIPGHTSLEQPLGQSLRQAQTGQGYLGNVLPTWQFEGQPGVCAQLGNSENSGAHALKQDWVNRQSFYIQGNEKPQLCQQTGPVYRVNTSLEHASYDTHTMEEVYSQALYDTGTMTPAPQDSYDADALVRTESYRHATFNKDTMVTAHSHNSNGTATQGTHPQALPPQHNLLPSLQPSTDQSELRKLLTLQTSTLVPPDLPPGMEVWSQDMNLLPQLTGEDLEMLDICHQ